MHCVLPQTLVLGVVDEAVPEFTEMYAVSLVSADSKDGYPSSTNTSGAWIDASQSQAMVTVAENDYPYGVMQFALTAPAEGDPTIPTATTIPQTSVMENDGSVTVYAVRAQGTSGSIQVDFATEDGTAVSIGIGADYSSAGGVLTFEDGERVQSIELQLLDDSEPEQAKYFFINMSNPDGSEYMH